MKAITTTTPVYTNENDTCGNPFSLTPYVNDRGEIWLASDGNGAGNDVMLQDLCGWSRDDVEREYGSDIDIDAMRKDADEIEASGDADNADWLRSWCDDYERLIKIGSKGVEK